MALRLDVPVYEQETDWSCGASALRSVLAYGGIYETEAALRHVAGTTEEGTSPEGIVCAAARYNVPACIWLGASLEGVCEAVDRGSPVIVSVQAWSEKGRPRGHRGYAAARPEPTDDGDETWTNGHWVTLVAAGPRRLVFCDPSMPDGNATLTRTEFLRRWHDYDRPDEPYHRLAIVFPAPSTPRWRRIGRVHSMG